MLCGLTEDYHRIIPRIEGNYSAFATFLIPSNFLGPGESWKARMIIHLETVISSQKNSRQSIWERFSSLNDVRVKGGGACTHM